MLSSYKIKLLNGAMRNRELQLPMGNLTLGTEDNDIVYFPLEQGLNQFLLDIREEGVFLLSPVEFWIDGQPTPYEADKPLPVGKIIDIAGCCFIIGDIDHSLPLSDVPERFSAKSRRKKRLILASVIGATFALSGAIGSYVLLSPKAEPPTFTRADVYQQLKENKLHAITLVWHGKNIALYGRCESTTDLTPFFNYLKEKNIFYYNKIICNNQIISAINDALTEYGYKDIIITKGNKPGFFLLSGYIPPSPKWSEVENLLLNTPGVAGWEIHNNSNNKINELASEFKKNKLINYVNIFKKNDVIIVAGEVSQQKESKILAIINAMNKNSNVKILFQNIQPYIAADIFPGKILRISGTMKNPTIALDNGTSLGIGSILKGGYVIDAIDPKDGINISRPDEYIHIPLSY
ncbi:type III secretion system LEE inner membrane ring protein EscD [Escherichia coli]